MTANVTANSASLPVSWSSSNPAIATVDKNGLVTPQALGSAMITAATRDGYTAQVMVTVETQTSITIAGEPTRTLTAGLSEQLTATVTQNSTALPVTWASSNEAAATVNEHGIVTAKAPGSAIITATTQDGYSAQVLVTVGKEQCWFARVWNTFLNWLLTPFRWLWNAISYPFRAIGKL